MKVKPRKAKSPVNEEFEAACLLWRMTFSCEIFQVVRAGIEDLLATKLDGSDPRYYPLSGARSYDWSLKRRFTFT